MIRIETSPHMERDWPGLPRSLDSFSNSRGPRDIAAGAPSGASAVLGSWEDVAASDSRAAVERLPQSLPVARKQGQAGRRR
jgi:hypothetical protein